LGETIQKSSKCNLGQTGPKPVLDAIDHFEDEFSGAIQLQKKIPRQEYKIKVTAPCESACPSHLPITRYIELIKEGRFRGISWLPFEGRPVWPGSWEGFGVRPCEDNCRRVEMWMNVFY